MDFDFDAYMDRHLKNMGLVRWNDAMGIKKLEIGSDDVTSAYFNMRDELGYPLMMDSKRRRAIIYNKKGLEKKIQQLINDCIVKNAHLLEDMIVNDIVYQLNGLSQTANGTFVNKKSNKQSNSKIIFIDAMAKGLVKGVGVIVDEITNPKGIK